jgi:bifunctional ADP-heptose synthase (sugar kinase/adenylyltransferase)
VYSCQVYSEYCRKLCSFINGSLGIAFYPSNKSTFKFETSANQSYHVLNLGDTILYILDFLLLLLSNH